METQPHSGENIDPPRKVSIVIPVFNEEAVLGQFHARLSTVLDRLDTKSEIVYVNDGSRDGSLPVLLSLSKTDYRVRIVDLARNFGKELALSAGLDQSDGDAVIIIDADLQDPPELIPDMLKAWQDGGDVILMQRRQRHGESWFKKASDAMFYRLIHHVGHARMPQNVGDFRLLSRVAVDALKSCRERNRMMKELFAWVGFRQTILIYDRESRYAGRTKWSYWRLWNLALEGITSSSTAPLKLATYAGLIILFFAFGYGGINLIQAAQLGEGLNDHQIMLLGFLTLGAIQLLGLGIVGEYLARVFIETKQRPLYLVKNIFSQTSVE